MPLDPSIILGAKPVQFDMAQFSPLNAFTTAMKLKQLGQEGELNALTLGERKGLQSFLAGNPDLSLPETRYKLATQFGEAGRKLSEGVVNIGKAQTDESKRRNDLVVSKTGLYRDALIDVNDQRSAIKWLQTQQNDPDMLGSPVTKVSIMDAARSIPADPQGFAQWKQQASLGLSEYIKQNKPSFQQINRNGQTDLLQTPGLGGTPTTLGTYADVPLPAAVLAQKKEVARAGAINLPVQEKAFEGELGKGQAKRIIDSQVAAQDAAAIIDTVKTGRDIMKSGMITGAGAEFLVSFNQALKTAGIDAGYADASANSQAYAANMAANVGKLIKQFGAGTGLSDADREFATAMAGGKIAVDAKAISRILDINEKAARNTITRHNKDVKGIKTNIPLEVQMPPEVKSAPAPITAVNPTTGARIQSTDGGKTWSPVGGK
jgi:hypothetical protein